MSPEGTPHVPDFQLPAVVGPALSYSSVERSLSRARLVLDQLGDKLKSAFVAGATGAAEQGAKIESKVGTRLAQMLDEPEALYNSLGDLILNSIAGNMAPAVAAAEDLGIATGRTGRSAKSVATGAMVTPRAAPGLTDAGQFVQPGDAARGISHGALTAQENELGVDPDIQGAQITVTGQPPDTPGQGQGSPASPQAQAWLAQCQQQDPSGSSCVGPYQVWAPPQPLSAEQMAAGLTNPCAVVGGGATIPSGWIPCGNPTGDLDAALAFAAACTAAGGQCPPGSAGAGGPVPTPTPTPTAPPTSPPPIGGPPPPPPPPPCCPEISIPPCPTLVLPECVQVDLCNWDKLCSTLTDCITQGTQAGDCALDNETAYTYKDCDGTFGSSVTGWFGNEMAAAANAQNVKDFVEAGFGAYTPLDDTSFSLDNGVTAGFGPEQP